MSTNTNTTPTESDCLIALHHAAFVASLEKAIGQAGGRIPWKELKHETLLTVMCRLATNGIRFTYNPDAHEDASEHVKAMSEAVPFLPGKDTYP